MLTNAQKQSFSEIGQTKRVIAIHIRYYFPFLSGYEGLTKPEDAILIGFFDEIIRSSLTFEHAKAFDEIFWYKVQISKNILQSELKF